MTIQRKVLVIMRSSHLHTEYVEVTAKVNVIGDATSPIVEADLAAVETLARKALRACPPLPGQKEAGFGPWYDPESAFEMEAVLCAPVDAGLNRGQIVLVKPVAIEPVARWGKHGETNDA
ncbi:MAG: hypothetical protein J7498_01295 [Sphingobium sp.]|nr:hypothetical protein [Sphingobium sp.]